MRIDRMNNQCRITTVMVSNAREEIRVARIDYNPDDGNNQITCGGWSGKKNTDGADYTIYLSDAEIKKIVEYAQKNRLMPPPKLTVVE